jgi:MFS family permease
MLLSFGLYAAIYSGFAFATMAWQIWSLVSFYGIYLGLSQGVLLAMTADRVPSDLRSTAFGLLNFSIGVSLLPGSLIAGWLWDNISPQAAFLAGAIFASGALLFFAFDKTECAPSQHETEAN